MIEFLSILITIVLFCYFLNYKNKKDRAEKEMDSIANAPIMSVNAEVLPLNNNNMEENQNLSTRDLCAEVLRKLNCDVQFDEENEYNMYFTYQGENFSVDTWENGLMITIWDTWWGTVDLDDLDDVSRVRKAINNINVRQNLTLMYSVDEKGQKFAVHTKRQCLLIPQIPQIENYMAAMLTDFFDVQRSFKEEYDRLRLEEANAKV
ncbi:MAG: hypothetical protein UFD09_02415 [Prevotella sp.]|nr:hypothetical protein [Prevotella sp.]